MSQMPSSKSAPSQILHGMRSKVGTELPPEAKFCMACGTQVADGVSVSDAPAIIPKLEALHGQLQSLIPEALVQKYLAAEQNAIGENRLITALFVDISGFTSLSATRSSETMFQLMQVFFKQLVNVVTRYEGRISGFRGDGLLALFGTPILHENDPERAILAAIDMRNTIQSQGLEVTVGINTAWMTVGEIQTELHKEYTAYGPDIILAKRLQETAKPGQILVGEDTYRPTRRAFAFQPLPPLMLKGIPEPVSAYQVLKPLPRPEKVRGIEGLRAEMIGREKEFAELKDCVDNLLAGKGQIVSIVGEAGVGKSRLVSELKTYIDKWEEESRAGSPDRSGCKHLPVHNDGRMEGKEGKEEPQSAIRNKPPSAIAWLEGRCVSIGEFIGYRLFTGGVSRTSEMAVIDDRIRKMRDGHSISFYSFLQENSRSEVDAGDAIGTGRHPDVDCSPRAKRRWCFDNGCHCAGYP